MKTDSLDIIIKKLEQSDTNDNHDHMNNAEGAPKPEHQDKIYNRDFYRAVNALDIARSAVSRLTIDFENQNTVSEEDYKKIVGECQKGIAEVFREKLNIGREAWDKAVEQDQAE